MFKYILKRIGLMLLTLFIIVTISFILIKLLQPPLSESGTQNAIEEARRKALGWDKPVLVQYGIYLRNIFLNPLWGKSFTEVYENGVLVTVPVEHPWRIFAWDWGVSWKIDKLTSVTTVISARMLPTIMVNVYSLVIGIPLGLAIGIYSALKKDRWQDMFLSVVVMIFISLPSFVDAFLLQYFVVFKWGWLPTKNLMMLSLSDLTQAIGVAYRDHYILSDFFTLPMIKSIILPVFALSFGSIAGLARSVRAELTEALTSDYMLLARTKGLTKAQATIRHAFKNSMVPILPGIIGSFISVLGGSMIIENIFSIPGVGSLFIQAIQNLDYDLYNYIGFFYTSIGLLSGILIDLSYGFLDPRIRMGAR